MNVKFNMHLTEHFNIFCCDEDSGIVFAIGESIEEIIQTLSNDFSLPPIKDKYDFYICPDAESFICLSGIPKDRYQSWMVGNADYPSKRLCVISPRAVTDRSEDDMYKVILHEAVHIAMDSLGSPDMLEAWISEGIAVLYADQTFPEYVDEIGFPLLADISGDGFAQNGGYQYAGIYVRYFIEKFGAGAFRRVYAGEESSGIYTYSGFEAEAIKSYKNSLI